MENNVSKVYIGPNFHACAATADGIRRQIDYLKKVDFANPTLKGQLEVLSYIEMKIGDVLSFQTETYEKFNDINFEQETDKPAEFDLSTIFMCINEYLTFIKKPINKLRDESDPVNKKKRKDEIKSLTDRNQTWFVAYMDKIKSEEK